jgi:hypothetical protein
VLAGNLKAFKETVDTIVFGEERLVPCAVESMEELVWLDTKLAEDGIKFGEWGLKIALGLIPDGDVSEENFVGVLLIPREVTGRENRRQWAKRERKRQKLFASSPLFSQLFSNR